MSYHDEVLVGFGEFLDKVGRQFSGALGTQTYIGITNKSQMKAKQLYQERLPGGGESMADAVKFEVLENSADRWVGRLSCSHPWASAVETGTDPHIIEARGGGIGVGEAKKYGREKGWEIPKNWIPTEEISMGEMKKRSAAEGADPYYGKYRVTLKKKRSDTKWGIKPGSEKIDIVVDPEHNETTIEASQPTKAHEYLHAVMQQTRGIALSKKEERYQHAHTALVEERTRARIEGGDKGYMFIQDWLPERGGGRGSQTPPWGTRYVKKPSKFTKVDHPGARSFHVFRDTKNFMVGEIPRMIQEFIEGFK